eukprot:m.15170 g.15170  ORF g.15170 m.15170 type:complete len:156 (+) comp5310_c0_seq1:216-683(+)
MEDEAVTPWPREAWVCEWMSRPDAEETLKKNGHKHGTFLVRPYGPQKKQAWIVSLILIDTVRKVRSLVHLLLDKDKEESPFTVNGDPVGECFTLDAVIHKLRLMGDDFEFPLKHPMNIDRVKIEPKAADSGGRLITRTRKASLKLSDKKAVPCLL